MEPQVQKEIVHIRELIIKMATLVEEAVRGAIEAFLNTDCAKAKWVSEGDDEINALEMLIDKAIFECLALRSPVAGDLRFLFSVQKMNKDFERIGDHAVNIAQAAVNCSRFGRPLVVPYIALMASLTRRMLSDAVTCFIQVDPQLALKVLEHDDQVDELNKAMTREVINMVTRDLKALEGALELLGVSKNLERIADLSTNIAEDLIFHAQGRDIKHQRLNGTERLAQMLAL